jgi:AraC-like DNA-binding protein
MGATLLASVVARVVDEAVRRGIDAAELAAMVGPREGLVGDARVAIEATFRIFELAMSHTRDPAFPIHVARSVALEDYSVLGFASMTSPNAEIVLERMARFGHLISDSGAWITKRSASVLELSWRRAGKRTLGHRAANECAVAEIAGGLRGGFGAAASPLRIHFRHPAPRDTRAHEAHFGAPIEWESTREGLDLPLSFLAARPLGGGDNPALSRYFETVLERRAEAAATVTDRVRALLLEGLSSGPPAAAHVASQLGMSERSLRRALSVEQTTYRALLDDLRREAARDLLESKRSVTETAFLLGFSETSALSRAFRRWHGASTRDVKREARDARGG